MQQAMVRASERALPSIEKARELLTKCRSVQEVMRIKALAQAVASCEASERARDEASAIVLLSKARIGELTATIEQVPNRGGRNRLTNGKSIVPKREALKADGLSEKDAAECEKIAELKKSGDLDRMLKSGARPTTAGAVALAKLPAPMRKKALASLGDKPDVRAAITAVKHEAAHDARAAAARVAPETAKVRFVEAVSLLDKLGHDSVDLLLTDPPYMTDVPRGDVRAFAASWIPSALAAVKLTGRAYICIGAYPEELNVYLSILLGQSRLRLANVLPWTYRNTLGPAPSHDYKQNWQAVLYLVGPKAPPLQCPVLVEQFAVQDINAPDGRLGDRYHAWQKPDLLAERFVRHSSKPGDLVVDPFAGTGTFLLAAAKLGRRAIGSDNSRANLDIAVSRGCVLEG